MRKKTIDMILVLSDDIKIVLSSFSKIRSLPAGLGKRSKIILLVSQGISNQTIASQIGLNYNHGTNWRNRFLVALLLLTAKIKKQRIVDRISGKSVNRFFMR